MAEIVNLRRARKDRARAEKEAGAAENRTRFGRTKGEKRKAEVEQGRVKSTLDGKKLEDDPGT